MYFIALSLSKKDKIDHITKKFKDSHRLNPSFINRIDDLMDEDTLDEEDIIRFEDNYGRTK